MSFVKLVRSEDGWEYYCEYDGGIKLATRYFRVNTDNGKIEDFDSYTKMAITRWHSVLEALSK